MTITITKEERDCFLTEYSGRCYHEDFWATSSDGEGETSGWQCSKCNAKRKFASAVFSSHRHSESNPDFSTWKGFGMLYSWATLQGWYHGTINSKGVETLLQYKDGLTPDNFANALYLLLKEH
jgi:hypothetical protein